MIRPVSNQRAGEPVYWTLVQWLRSSSVSGISPNIAGQPSSLDKSVRCGRHHPEFTYALFLSSPTLLFYDQREYVPAFGLEHRFGVDTTEDVRQGCDLTGPWSGGSPPAPSRCRRGGNAWVAKALTSCSNGKSTRSQTNWARSGAAAASSLAACINPGPPPVIISQPISAKAAAARLVSSSGVRPCRSEDRHTVALMLGWLEPREIVDDVSKAENRVH